MQKHWIRLITVIFVLMLFALPIYAEEAGSEDGKQPAQQELGTGETAAPSDHDGGSVAEDQGAAAGSPEAAQTDNAAAATTPIPATTATIPPIPEATEAADNSGDSTEGDDFATEVEINVDGAQSEEESPMPLSRNTWVALNVSMIGASKENADPKAKASWIMTQLLLARSVANSAPVGVVMMNDSNPVFEGAITSAEEWNALIGKLEKADFPEKGKKESADQFRALIRKLNQKIYAKDGALKEADIWVLATQPKGRLGDVGKENINKFSKAEDVFMRFLSFRRSDEARGEKEKWLDDEIKEKGMANFEAEPFYYDVIVENPIVEAMKTFGLNLKEPAITPEKDENGDIIYQHAGKDTLLILTTEEGNVSVTADTAQVAGKGFPIVMKMDGRQYMVLLHNVSAGSYRISGQVSQLAKAYKFEMPEPVLMEASTNGTAIKWYLEDQEFTVSLNVPQPAAEGIRLAIYFKDQQGNVSELSNSITESGTQWKVKVPRQLLESVTSGSIQIEASKGDPADPGYCVTESSPQYLFVVENRPLAPAQEESADLVYYYHIPGIQADQPMKVDLACYVTNLDQRKLTYTPDAAEYKIEGDTLSFTSDGNRQARSFLLQACDGYSEPVSFSINIQQEDFMEKMLAGPVQIDTTEYTGELGKAFTISFTLPAEMSKLYAEVRNQYPMLPEKLEEAFLISATITGDSKNDNGIVNLSAQEDGSILCELEVPAYVKCEEHGVVTFDITINGEQIQEQKLIPSCTFKVPNDQPKIAEGIVREMKVKAVIQGAPGKRVPLTFAMINEDQKEAATRLPVPFIPEALFTDLQNINGLTITIKAEPASLVELLPIDPVTGAPAAEGIIGDNGTWVLDSDISKQAHELRILDKGNVTLTITASDNENESEGAICWTIKVSSSFDTMMLIVIIAVAVLIAVIIVLLILYQIHKPSFNNMKIMMRIGNEQNQWDTSQAAWAEAPLDIYGKKETDLVPLFIACQQPPMLSIPIDLLADVAIRPGKTAYRLILGKRAQLNVSVENQAQNTQKPVIFGKEQEVCIYADPREVLYLKIMQNW